MRILLIHQNFPGQFRQLTPFLQGLGHDLVAICSHERDLPAGLRVVRYQEPVVPSCELPLSTLLWHEALSRSSIVAQICSKLNIEGWSPDCILAHTGWGETLGISEVWPDVPQLVWPELWLRPEHGGTGIDPQKPKVELSHYLDHIGRNCLTAQALKFSKAWILPTLHQANSFPREYQGSSLNVVHEGIDTKLACPDPFVSFEVRGILIDRSVPTITFVNRNLERLRGFDMFMRSLTIIQSQHPTVRILIVGDNEGGYGGGHPSGLPLRDVMMRELGEKLDKDRIHFLGRIPHTYLIKVLQASWVHVYLSYPFILGWSLLEAMSCGCCIVGSRGMPVEEVIHDGIDGVLVPMDDHNRLAQRVLFLLENSSLRNQFGSAARQSSMVWDQSVTLPKLVSLIENSVSS